MVADHKYTSGEVIQALRMKHAEDVFVSECKDGPTQRVATHCKLDAWVMEKSWARPRVVGYEIKVSRADFLHDTKWTTYLPLCNELYFIAPKGIIQANELTPEVGLMEILGKTRIVTRKKAAYREIVVPEELYRYILMCRAKIQEDEDDPRFRLSNRKNRLVFWRQWLEHRKEGKDLGYDVSKAIRDHVKAVDSENSRLRELHKSYDELRPLLNQLGFTEEDAAYSWDVKRRVERMKALLPEDMVYRLKGARDDIDKVLAIVAEEEARLQSPKH